MQMADALAEAVQSAKGSAAWEAMKEDLTKMREQNLREVFGLPVHAIHKVVDEALASGLYDQYTKPITEAPRMREIENVDTINSPSHYTAGKIETIEIIDDLGLTDGFCRGNAIKYISRADYKGTKIEDLKKARWYLTHLIEQLEADDEAEVVTPRENSRRGNAGKATGARQRAKTHCPAGHPYDEANTYVRPDTGERTCRKCSAARRRRWEARRRGE